MNFNEFSMYIYLGEKGGGGMHLCMYMYGNTY